MINEAKLFASIRSIANQPLSQVQVDSVHAILENCERFGITDNRMIAYILATAYHEARLKPIEEIGKGTGKAYGKLINGHAYYGRGFVQLTWIDNYRTFGDLLKIDLVNHPELALNIDYAGEIIVYGMFHGSFTGVGLKKYFTATLADAYNARKIINGLDAATLIKGYYEHILEGLQ